MMVKTFEASSMAEALSKVKGELGPRAVILHTRSLRRGGVMGFMARNVVEITASADVRIAAGKRRSEGRGAAGGPGAERGRGAAQPGAECLREGGRRGGRFRGGHGRDQRGTWRGIDRRALCNDAGNGDGGAQGAGV